MRPIVTISAGAARAILEIVPTQDVRYYMNGICLDTARRVLVVTDGHTMLVARPASFAPASGGQLIVPRDAVANACKIAGAAGSLEFHAAEIRALDKHCALVAAIAFVPIEGRYPDYARVVPRAKAARDTTAAQFNPQYVLKASNALRELADAGKANNLYAFVQHGGETRAAVITFGSLDAFAIVMPVRGERGECALLAEFTV